MSRPRVVGTEAFLGGAGIPLPKPQSRLEPPPDAPVSLVRRWALPAVLFVLTCLTTRQVGDTWSQSGWLYAFGIMTILLFHELGHFLQARRYGVPASPPHFIPMPWPLSPLGTMGAVIGMHSRIPSSRALYDIAITGPLAGLVPTLIFGVVGIQHSTHGGFVTRPPWLSGKPILFTALESLLLGSDLPGLAISYHPLAVAAWTGLFITALNLIPIGQLDGGHILYTLVRKKAHTVSIGLVVLAALAICWNFSVYWPWCLMLGLLVLMGVRHPPTENDKAPLGTGRIVLGWITLMFVLVGFTPSPFPMR